jgi:hypothetical protein
VTEQMLNATNSEVVEGKVDLSKYAPIENFKELQNKVDMLNERLNTYEKFINNLTQPKQIENVETKQDEKINPLLKYQEYIYYKEEYNETHKQENLSIIHQALSTFLEGMIGAFENIEEVSRDNMEERALIKGKIKQIYQAFS